MQWQWEDEREEEADWWHSDNGDPSNDDTDDESVEAGDEEFSRFEQRKRKAYTASQNSSCSGCSHFEGEPDGWCRKAAGADPKTVGEEVTTEEMQAAFQFMQEATEGGDIITESAEGVVIENAEEIATGNAAVIDQETGNQDENNAEMSSNGNATSTLTETAEATMGGKTHQHNASADTAAEVTEQAKTVQDRRRRQNEQRQDEIRDKVKKRQNETVGQQHDQQKRRNVQSKGRNDPPLMERASFRGQNMHYVEPSVEAQRLVFGKQRNEIEGIAYHLNSWRAHRDHKEYVMCVGTHLREGLVEKIIKADPVTLNTTFEVSGNHLHQLVKAAKFDKGTKEKQKWTVFSQLIGVQSALAIQKDEKLAKTVEYKAQDMGESSSSGRNDCREYQSPDDLPTLAGKRGGRGGLPKWGGRGQYQHDRSIMRDGSSHRGGRFVGRGGGRGRGFGRGRFGNRMRH